MGFDEPCQVEGKLALYANFLPLIDPLGQPRAAEEHGTVRGRTDSTTGQTIEHNYDTTMESCLILYNTLIQKGVAPEQARMVLPQSMMTEWYWSGTVYAFARVCNLRCKPDTQKETQDVANVIDKLSGEAFPHCWKYLRK